MPRYGPHGELFQCSGCHTYDYLVGFKINRLGIRLKTCLRCVAREQTPKRVAGRKAQVQKKTASLLSPPACATAAVLTDSDVDEILAELMGSPSEVAAY